jgi:hypothetical protein
MVGYSHYRPIVSSEAVERQNLDVVFVRMM